MAKQESIILLNGKIGNMSFFKTKDGYSARKRTGVAASDMAGNPQFDRTRENMAEFGRAASAAKLIRFALLEAMVGAKDRKIVPRLTRALMAVIKTDIGHSRGNRVVTGGRLTLLEGFECNIAAALSTVLLTDYAATIDRQTGRCIVDFPSFVPKLRIPKATSATHFRLGITAASADFAINKAKSETAVTAYLPINEEPTPLQTLEAKLEPNGTNPIFLAATIEFVQETNGIMYTLKNGLFNSCALVKVDHDA